MDDLYKEIRKIINKFINEEYFSRFTSADIFYIETLKKKRSIITFMDNFYGEYYGIQLFFNQDGLNYVHDIVSYEDPIFITVADCDSLCLVLLPRENLSEDDIKYLKNNKVNIKEENNIIIYRFKRGYGRTYANIKEMTILLDKLNLLNAVIPNEYDSIIEAFNKELAVISIVDTDKYVYTNFYKPLPYLESISISKKINTDFVNEYKNKGISNDTIYVLSSYLPIILEGSLIRPLLVIFYSPFNEKINVHSLTNKPKDYKNIIWSILDEVFTNNGIPSKIVFSNRYLYGVVRNTLKELNIECVYDFKIQDSDLINQNIRNNMQDAIARIYNQSNDEIMASKEAGDLILLAIEEIINGIAYEIEDEIKDKEDDLIS